MRKATKKDKNKVIKIPAESFDTNNSVNSVVKQDKKRKRGLNI